MSYSFSILSLSQHQIDWQGSQGVIAPAEPVVSVRCPGGWQCRPNQATLPSSGPSSESPHRIRPTNHVGSLCCSRAHQFFFFGRRPLPFGGSHLRLPSGPAGIRTTTGSLSALARPTPYQLSHRVALLTGAPDCTAGSSTGQRQ